MTHEKLQQKAFKNKNVKNKYDKLDLEFQLLNEILTAITRLESALSIGNHSPSLSTIKKYANAVGCRLDIRFVHNQENV